MDDSESYIARAIEDRVLQRQFNRNPRLHSRTKAEKSRSEKIGARNGNQRDIDLKVRILNKIVREASGIHTYTLVPPPKKKGEIVEPDVDPETNPQVKSYTKETKKKPKIISYGHRPSSASKTFNPGTMKFRMKHDELAKAPKDGVFEFGMPAGVLAKVLRASPLRNELEMEESTTNVNTTNVNNNSFRNRKEREEVNNFQILNDDDISPTKGSIGGGGDDKSYRSFGSSQISSGINDMDKYYSDLTAGWNSAHHIIPPADRQAQLYKLKTNHMRSNELTLKERLLRFKQKSVSDDVQTLSLPPKKSLASLKSSLSEFGIDPISDPLNVQLQHVKLMGKRNEAAKEKRIKAKIFQHSIRAIPKVAYHPATMNELLQDNRIQLKEVSALAKTKTRFWEDADFEDEDDFDHQKHVSENLLSKSMRRARVHGDQHALKALIPTHI